MQGQPNPPAYCLVGRTSSHFTRTARIFAEELGIAYRFRNLPDLLSRDLADYGGNPALRIPVLETPDGAWFGAANVCREFARRAATKLRIVWPEDLETALLGNAQELALQTMSTGVTLILSRLQPPQGAAGGGEGKHVLKMQTSLTNTLAWLDARLPEVLAALPKERDLSYLEVTLFCMFMHLQFREVVPTEPYAELQAFCDRFGTRRSAVETAFYFEK